MEKNKNTLYEYVIFIWRKKLWVIGFTILCLVIAGAFSFTSKQHVSATALVFTGNATNDFLSKPELIMDKYEETIPEDIRGSFFVKIEEPFQISLSLTGNDKETVEKELRKVAEKYTSDLKKRFDDQYKTLEQYTEILKRKIDKTEETINYYNEKISEETNGDKLSYYTELVIKAEEDIGEYYSEYYKANYKLTLAESPELMNINTEETGNNLTRNLLLAGAFGFQMMIIILVIWKYILNSREA